MLHAPLFHEHARQRISQADVPQPDVGAVFQETGGVAVIIGVAVYGPGNGVAGAGTCPSFIYLAFQVGEKVAAQAGNNGFPGGIHLCAAGISKGEVKVKIFIGKGVVPSAKEIGIGGANYLPVVYVYHAVAIYILVNNIARPYTGAV